MMVPEAEVKALYYDGAWSIISPMQTGRATPGIAAIDTNRTLVCGGWSEKSCEIFNSSTGQWSAAASANAVGNDPKMFPLANGKILAVGGVAPGTDNGLNLIKRLPLHQLF
jgi:hypothetical protein